MNLRSFLRVQSQCLHDFGDWRARRSRVHGWQLVRACVRCSHVERRAVLLRPPAPA